MPTSIIANYSTFVANPNRRDVYSYTVTVRDASGTEQTLYWCKGKALKTSPSESPANITFEPRVLEGGYEYQGPSFDPFNPQYGVLTAGAQQPLVIAQIDGDFDAKKDWLWPSARIVVRHGGYSDQGWLVYSAWRVVNTVEVDGLPIFDLDKVTFSLRTLDARLDQPVERRKLAGLGWGIEGDGSAAGVTFKPFAPGIRERQRKQGVAGYQSTVNVIVSMPDSVAGDLLVVDIGSHHQTVAGVYQDWSITAAPAGWTADPSSPAVTSAGGVAAHRLYRYYRVATGAETETYTWTGTGTACSRVWSATSLYGQDGTTPVPTSSESSPDTIETTATAPTVTTTVAGDVMLCGVVGQRVADYAVPSGMTELASISKHTAGSSNRVSLKSAYEVRPTTGATGTRTFQLGSSRYAAITTVLQNRAASASVPTKLDQRDAVSYQFSIVVGPYVAGEQQIFGWETTPFRCYLYGAADEMKLRWEWVKSTVTVTKESAFVFEPGRRYHVEIAHADTSVTFYIYDWWADSETTETFSGTGFNNRDAPGASDEYTLLYNRNGGSPASRFRGQLWDLRGWSNTQSETNLQDRRMRPLTDAEQYDANLFQYVPFDEKTGLVCGDRALDPADGTMAQTVTGPLAISAVAATPSEPAKFTRAAGSFITDGWVAGRMFQSAQFAKSANNGRGRVVDVAALTLSVDGIDLEAETGSGDETIKSDDWRPTLTGTPEQIGQDVPCFFGGPKKGWPGLMVEASTDGAIFVVHPVAIEEFLGVQEGGAPLNVSADFDDYLTFLATLPPVGSVTTYSGDLGSFYRLRIVPTKPTTCELKGDAFDGTFVSTAADIVRRVLTTRGEEPLTDPTDLDTSSIATLNTAAPYPQGIGVGSGETIRDFCRRLLGGIGAVAWPLRNGTFRFKRFEAPPGSAGTVIHRKMYRQPPIAVECAMPAKQVTIRFNPNFLPLTRDQIDGEIVDRALLAYLLSEWRVSHSSRWQVARNYPRARTIEIDSYFCDYLRAWQHAGTERARVLTLYAEPSELLSLDARRTWTPIEFLDTVTLTVADLDYDRDVRVRLGIDATNYLATQITDDSRNGSGRLQLWRPDRNG